MPKLVYPLTNIQLRNAKPNENPYKRSDGAGLYLEVMPIGSKLWRMKFKQANGKKNNLASPLRLTQTWIGSNDLLKTSSGWNAASYFHLLHGCSQSPPKYWSIGLC